MDGWLEEGNGVEEACAWCIVFTCKVRSCSCPCLCAFCVTESYLVRTVCFPEFTHHHPTHQFFPHLLLVITLPLHIDHIDQLLYTNTLLRRVLTATIHRSKLREQFDAVGDLLVGRFCAVVRRFAERQLRGEGDEGEELGPLRRVLEVISVPCSVRQGSRMSRKCFTNWSGVPI